jgi:hypothetical protein
MTTLRILSEYNQRKQFNVGTQVIPNINKKLAISKLLAIRLRLVVKFQNIPRTIMKKDFRLQDRTHRNWFTQGMHPTLQQLEEAERDQQLKIISSGGKVSEIKDTQ